MIDLNVAPIQSSSTRRSSAAIRSAVADTKTLASIVGFSAVRATDEPCVRRQFRSRGDIHNETYSDGIAICEELIVYCAVLEARRIDYARRAARSEALLQELNETFTFTRDREKEHLAVLEEFRLKKAGLQREYINFKSEAKEFIRNLQERKAEKQQLQAKKAAKLAEQELLLSAVQNAIETKSEELSILNQRLENAPSTTELEDLRRRIRDLQQENESLAVQVHSLSKRSRKLEIALGHDSAEPEKLELEIQELKRQRREQAKHFEGVIADVNAEAEFNQKHATVLLGQLDGAKSG
ncbi:MAG: uncharacterized protein KVP18_001691 [Porospora cf. gigantea A]|uniref:uncharacterized protein n=1 Tax=Porospora cf. gigantea A TaxID=2853593 RepID=UPI003559D34F|nr:MAG: hypothetical protein KVP18_001691 [Porospora cf. gigantea A]